MLLNGLWVVCDDVPAKAAAAPLTRELSEQEANCVTICTRLLNELGDFCIILPGDARKSITVVDFGAAILTPQTGLQLPAGVKEFLAELPVFYLTPVLSQHTPPPKA